LSAKKREKMQVLVILLVLSLLDLKVNAINSRLRDTAVVLKLSPDDPCNNVSKFVQRV
jgi:hypothetical protein